MDGFKNSTKTSYDTTSGKKFAGGGMMVSRNDTVGGEAPMNKPAMVAKYAKGGHVTKAEKKVGRVMKEFSEGKLHSGSKKGPEVKNPKQAIAIALNEARAAGAKIPMTTPVFFRGTNDTERMSFVRPPEMSAGSVPLPSDKMVQVSERPKGTFAVMPIGTKRTRPYLESIG